jgi:GNAT superfamily N-acetyltransferase
VIRVITLRLYGQRLAAAAPPGDSPPEVDLEVWESARDRDVSWHLDGPRRFRDGQVCAVARHDKQIVAYCWLAYTPIPVAEIDRVVVPASDEVYLYDAFTHPGWRGRGLFTLMLRHLLAYARSQGRRRALIFAEARNLPSCRAIERAGFEIFQTVVRLDVLGFTRQWSRGRPPQASRITLIDARRL